MLVVIFQNSLTSIFRPTQAPSDLTQNLCLKQAKSHSVRSRSELKIHESFLVLELQLTTCLPQSIPPLFGWLFLLFVLCQSTMSLLIAALTVSALLQTSMGQFATTDMYYNMSNMSTTTSASTVSCGDEVSGNSTFKIVEYFPCFHSLGFIQRFHCSTGRLHERRGPRVCHCI